MYFTLSVCKIWVKKKNEKKLQRIFIVKKRKGYSSYYVELEIFWSTWIHVCVKVLYYFDELENVSSNMIYVSTQKNSLSPENILKLYF